MLWCEWRELAYNFSSSALDLGVRCQPARWPFADVSDGLAFDRTRFWKCLAIEEVHWYLGWRPSICGWSLSVFLILMMKKFIRLLLIKLVRIKTPMIRIETLEISFSGCLNKQQQLALRIKDFFLFIFGDAKCSHYFEWIVGSFSYVQSTGLWRNAIFDFTYNYFREITSGECGSIVVRIDSQTISMWHFFSGNQHVTFLRWHYDDDLNTGARMPIFRSYIK